MEQGFRTLTSSDIRDTSSTQDTELGAVGLTGDGRWYRYAKTGSSNVAVGLLVVAEAIVANHTNVAVAAAAAVGDTRVSVTLGATAAAQDLYAEGYLTVNASTGAGTTYKITGHPAIGSAGTGYIYLEEPLKAALTTSSKVSLNKSPWKDVVTSTTASNSVGVLNVAIAASSYGWVQTRGIASVQFENTAAAAKAGGVIQSTATAGNVTGEAAATVTQRVGYAPEALTNAEYRPVILTID